MIGIAVTGASILWILVFLVGVPSIAGLLFTAPKARNLLLGTLAFSICHVKKPWYMEVFFEDYRGVDRGFGVTMADLIFFGFALWILLGGQRQRRTVYWPYNFAPFLVLILLSAISIAMSPVAYYGLFTLHKFVRGAVLYWVIINLVHSRKDVFTVFYGLFASVVFQLVESMYHKYVTGAVVNRVVGSFPHPNSLAMYVDLVMPIALAVLLLSSGKRKLDLLAAGAVLSGVVCVVFTKSRAALGIMSMALVLTPPLCFIIKPTSRQVGIMALGLVVMSGIGAMAAPKLIARFQNAPKESAETREYFNHAAAAMAAEYPFGTGLNSYSWMLGNTSYYWYVYPDKRAEVSDKNAFRKSEQGQSRLGTCHHIYWLFAAETGWLGMYVFILWIVRFFWMNLRSAFRERDPLNKAIFIGMAFGFWTLHIQGFLEWIFRQTSVFYLFFLVSGLLVAMTRRSGTPEMAPAQA